jgi:hypothetical protein
MTSRRNEEMPTTRPTPSLENIQAVLAIATALVALGLLPKTWQKTLGVLSSVAWLANRL